MMRMMIADAQPTRDELSETLSKDCRLDDKQSTLTASYRPKASSLPTSIARTIQLQLEYDDDDGGDNNIVVPTTIILQLFSDRTFISITQLSGKMGSLFVCNVEESIIDNSTTYHISTLLGTGVPGGNNCNFAHQEVSMREVYVRRLAERIGLHARKMAGMGEGAMLGGSETGSRPIPPIVVGLGLRPNNSGKRLSIQGFNAIVDAAMELYEEGWRICHSGSMVGMEGPD